MNGLMGFPMQPAQPKFSASRVNLAKKAEELSVIKAGLVESLNQITPNNLQRYEFINVIYEQLGQVIQQNREIRDLLGMLTYISRDHPANISAEKAAIQVESHTEEARRYLRKIAVRRTGCLEITREQNSLRVTAANLAIALSTLCRVLQESDYQDLFLLEEQ